MGPIWAPFGSHMGPHMVPHMFARPWFRTCFSSILCFYNLVAAAAALPRTLGEFLRVCRIMPHYSSNLGGEIPPKISWQCPGHCQEMGGAFGPHVSCPMRIPSSHIQVSLLRNRRGARPPQFLCNAQGIVAKPGGGEPPPILRNSL